MNGMHETFSKQNDDEKKEAKKEKKSARLV